MTKHPVNSCEDWRITTIWLKQQLLAKRYDCKFLTISTSKQLAFKINGKRQFVQVTPLSDVRGLDWLIVVVVPESDFTERIDANTRTTILLCLAALVLATLIGVIIFVFAALSSPI